MNRALVIVGYLLMVGCAGSGAVPTPQVPPPAPLAEGTQGMVSSAHPLATEAGLEILRAGGNAYDAAVATAAALNVVEPMMSGIGGYGTILIHDAETGTNQFLNSSGRIPQALDSDVFRAPTPNYMENRRGAKSVSTPGNVNAWNAMAQRGRLAWSELFGAAVRLAEEGYLIDERIAFLIERAYPDFPAHAKAFYGRDGRPLRAGERLVQKDLANSLRMIAADGARTFHGGVLGEMVDREMRAAGSFLRLSDLAENAPEWWDAISVDYRGYTVLTAPPPANSFPALVRLGLMAQFDVAAMGHNTPEYLHTFAEATKHGFGRGSRTPVTPTSRRHRLSGCCPRRISWARPRSLHRAPSLSSRPASCRSRGTTPPTSSLRIVGATSCPQRKRSAIRLAADSCRAAREFG